MVINFKAKFPAIQGLLLSVGISLWHFTRLTEMKGNLSGIDRSLFYGISQYNSCLAKGTLVDHAMAEVNSKSLIFGSIGS